MAEDGDPRVPGVRDVLLFERFNNGSGRGHGEPDARRNSKRAVIHGQRVLQDTEQTGQCGPKAAVSN